MQTDNRKWLTLKTNQILVCLEFMNPKIQKKIGSIMIVIEHCLISSIHLSVFDQILEREYNIYKPFPIFSLMVQYFLSIFI